MATQERDQPLIHPVGAAVTEGLDDTEHYELSDLDALGNMVLNSNDSEVIAKKDDIPDIPEAIEYEGRSKIVGTSENVMRDELPRNWASLTTLGLQIPVFSGEVGKSINVRDFVDKIEEYGRMACWTDQQKISVAKLRSADQAGVFTWKGPLMKHETSWTRFRSKLIDQYDREPVEIRRAKLSLIVQGVQEDVTEYSIRLYEAGQLCLDRTDGQSEDVESKTGLAEQALDAQLKNIFIIGLRDVNLKRSLLEDPPSTFEEAVKKARLAENRELIIRSKVKIAMVNQNRYPDDIERRVRALEQSRPTGTGPTSYQQQYVRKDEHWRTSNRGERPPTHTPIRNFRCWTCGEIGHLSRNCPEVFEQPSSQADSRNFREGPGDRDRELADDQADHRGVRDNQQWDKTPERWNNSTNKKGYEQGRNSLEINQVAQGGSSRYKHWQPLAAIRENSTSVETHEQPSVRPKTRPFQDTAVPKVTGPGNERQGSPGMQ